MQLPQTDAPSPETVFSVPLTSIRPGAHQPRKHFDEAALEQLAASIKTGGVVQPLFLRPLGDGNYEIVAGERRWRAARLAGLDSVPAIIKYVDDRGVMEVSIIENLQREDLNPIEEAEAYRRLTQEFGLSQEEAALRVGKDRSTIANALRLLKLPESIQGDVAAGLLSAGHARALLALPTPAAQMGLAERIKAKGLSVREVEALTNSPERAPKRRSAGPHDAHIREAEEDLKRKFGTKVKIRGTASKGRIEIEYYTNIDLIRLVDLLKA
ncbi:MAG: ParB/RepB/Spo0J family partition protein [Nitrospinota bacterium]